MLAKECTEEEREQGGETHGRGTMGTSTSLPKCGVVSAYWTPWLKNSWVESVTEESAKGKGGKEGSPSLVGEVYALLERKRVKGAPAGVVGRLKW